MVIRSPAGLLLLQRPAGGLWGQLWEFPTFEYASGKCSPADIRRLLRRELSLDARVRDTGVCLRHQLTHRTMDCRVFAAVAARSMPAIPLPPCDAGRYMAHRWVMTLDEVPVAGITRKILAAIPRETAEPKV